MKRNRYVYETVKRIVEQQDYFLISKQEIVDKNGFVKTATRIDVWCGKDGHSSYFVQFSKFLKGSRCRRCLIDSRKLSYRQVKRYFESFNYELLSESYESVHTPLKLKCPKGHVFNMQYANFQQGQRCPACGIQRRTQKRKYSYDYVEEYISKFGYILLSSEYMEAKEEIVLKCPKEHIWKTTFNSFKTGFRCAKCHGNERFEYEKVVNYIESFNYKVLSKEYLNCDNKMEIKCPNGHVFKMSFYNFKNRGSRCPVCNNSRGEKRIQFFLENNGIKYQMQHRFKNCRFKYTLPFDFYLSEYNTLIEYDGELHFKIVERFGGFDGFVDTKIRDTIKNIYCKENNIKLIRIPYWEFDNIEEILKDELNL